MNKSDYLANQILNGWLRGITPTLPSALYVALYTVEPTSAGGGVEVVGGAYQRQTVVFGAPSGKMVANTGAINFPTPTSAWGSVVAVGIFDALTAGNMLYFKAVQTTKNVDTKPVYFPVGYLTVQEL